MNGNEPDRWNQFIKVGSIVASVLCAVLLFGLTGRAQPKEVRDPENFFAAIRQGKLSLEERNGQYTIINSTNAGGDFPLQVSLVKIERHQVTLKVETSHRSFKPGEILTIATDRIQEILLIEGPGK